MMIEKLMVEIDLSTLEEDARYVEIEIACEYSIESTGIGKYEYFGHIGYDRGTDCVVIETMTWNTSLFTEAENKKIGDCVEKEKSKLEENISQIINDRKESSLSFYADED